MSTIKSDKITMVDIHKIQPNPKNANVHTPEQIERLKKLIDYQGFRNPLIISNRSGFLVAGHGRLEAAKDMGFTELPVTYQDFENEAQEYAYVVSDNEIARWARLDNDLVYEELKNLEIEDIELLGIEDFEIPAIEELDPQTDEDEVPEVEHPITRKGDIWLLGKHRLMCGDSTMIDDVEKLMNGEKADMVFTDPPYGVSFQSSQRVKSEKFDVLKNDDDFIDFLPCLEAVTKNNTPWFIWTSHHVYPKWREMYEDYYKSTIIWHKGGGGMGDLKSDYATDFEMALYCMKGKPQFIYNRPMATWKIGKDAAGKYVHPTQKPVELSEYAMGNFLRPQTNVIDLFLGSGSTLIGCEKTNRHCFGMELDEKYCDVIINRWQNYTGKKATLELTGQTYEDLKVERDG